MIKNGFINEQYPEYVKAYLSKYGSNIWNIEPEIKKLYNNIIVIPSLREYENIIRLLKSLSETDNKYFDETLFIFVINNSIAAEEEIKNDNHRTIELLKSIIEKEIDFTEDIARKVLNIGFVDACSHGKELNEKDAGVGLARKIGMDLSLRCFDYKNNVDKIIICLDADCKVDKNYLTEVIEKFRKEKMEAGYVQYEHQLPVDETEKNAIVCYEIFLRYYELGLKYAASPFAFAAIGSTMFCSPLSYCRVGGMNKRKAAEDFYFLEKLAKITNIKLVDSTRVFPSSRRSWRVPFGTGQRINRYIAKTHDEYLLYNPKIFTVLKKWNDVFYSKEIKNEKQLLEEANLIDNQLKIFLEINSFEGGWKKILNNSKTESQIQKQKLIWFDGFRTLKLVHYLRDNGFQQTNMFQSLDELFEMMKINPGIQRIKLIPSIEIQIEYLNTLRQNL